MRAANISGGWEDRVIRPSGDRVKSAARRDPQLAFFASALALVGGLGEMSQTPGCFPPPGSCRSYDGYPKARFLVQRLPHFQNSIIEVDKLKLYVLNPDHPQGKHKARVFKSMLGIEASHSDALAKILHETLPRALAVKDVADKFGDRWTTYHEVIGINGKAAVVTVAWIYKAESREKPSLVTCYIETGRQEELRRLLDLD